MKHMPKRDLTCKISSKECSLDQVYNNKVTVFARYYLVDIYIHSQNVVIIYNIFRCQFCCKQTWM